MEVKIRNIDGKAILFIDKKEVNITRVFNDYIISEFRHKKQIKNKNGDIYTVTIKREFPIYGGRYGDAGKLFYL